MTTSENTASENTATDQSAPHESREVVLITGAGGLIGSYVIRRLSEEYTIIGLDITPPKRETDAIDFIKTDLTEEDSIQSSLSEVKSQYGTRIASVVHLAAYYDFSGDPSPMYDELTVEGTRRFIRALKSQNFNVEQFIFSSSMLVMKPGKDGQQISEESETQAEWAYPQSKLDAEAVINDEAGDMPTVMLRIAGVYDEKGHSLPVGQQIARIYEKQMESYVFPGDPDHGQAVVHLEDLADCFYRAIQNRKSLSDSEMFLIAEPDVVSYGELQDVIGEHLHGAEWPTIRIPKFVAKTGAYVQNKLSSGEDQFIKPWMVDLADAHYAPDVSRANNRLNWYPEKRLRDTLPTILSFLKQNPQAFYKENGLSMPAGMKQKN